MPINEIVIMKRLMSNDKIVRTLFHVQKSYHLCTNTCDQDDQVIDLVFLLEKQHRQYQVHLEVHVYKHVFLNPLDFQNDVFVLYLLYNQDTDYQP
jgi:hypothetical protein